MNTISRFKYVKCKSCDVELRLNRRIVSKKYYCNECANKDQQLKCDRCNCDYVGKPKSHRNHICNVCIENNKSDLAGISSKTLTRIWNKAKLSCSICGWNECNCDIHHIIDVSKGGLDNLANLIAVCPNCHRKAHNNLFDIEFLREKSLKDFNIKDYYDSKRSISMIKNKKYYSEERSNEHIIDEDLLKLSDKEISEKYDIPLGEGINIRKDRFGSNRKRKFNPTKDELEKLISEHPMVTIGNIYGVSDNAVKKRCKKLGIELKPMRGHWSKMKSKVDKIK